jgi:methyl-accepting chemotaxis protein
MASVDPLATPDLGTSLVASLGQHREAILAKIRDANRMTEREVLAVGESLRLIVEEARAYVADSRKTLEQIASTSLTDMLERHGAVMSSFVDAVQQLVAAQSEASGQATNQINRIVDLGRAIERVTMESKILALNANIQARRLGASGDSFLVIAQEMKNFSASVSDANKGVQELAGGLLNVLPRINSLATSMRKTSEEFSADISERVAEVASTNAEMKREVAESMATGESRLQQILSLSYAALSHLQFQDTVAQGLLSCDKDMKVCLRLAERQVANGGAAGADSEVAESDSSADSSLDAGDVMLF